MGFAPIGILRLPQRVHVHLREQVTLPRVMRSDDS